MNEQLQNKLAEILGQIASGVKAAGDFTLTQLPDIAQQYVIYGRVSETFFTVMALILLAVWVRGIIWFWKKADDTDEYAIILFVGSGGGFTLAAFSLISLNHALLVWFAPKVWLIKEIAGLLK